MEILIVGDAFLLDYLLFSSFAMRHFLEAFNGWLLNFMTGILMTFLCMLIYSTLSRGIYRRGFGQGGYEYSQPVFKIPLS